MTRTIKTYTLPTGTTYHLKAEDNERTTRRPIEVVVLRWRYNDAALGVMGTLVQVLGHGHKLVVNSHHHAAMSADRSEWALAREMRKHRRQVAMFRGELDNAPATADEIAALEAQRAEPTDEQPDNVVQLDAHRPQPGDTPDTDDAQDVRECDALLEVVPAVPVDYTTVLVRSSKGDTHYTVTMFEPGRVNGCECRGATYHGHCWHQVAAELAEDTWEACEVLVSRGHAPEEIASSWRKYAAQGWGPSSIMLRMCISAGVRPASALTGVATG